MTVPGRTGAALVACAEFLCPHLSPAVAGLALVDEQIRAETGGHRNSG